MTDDEPPYVSVVSGGLEVSASERHTDSDPVDLESACRLAIEVLDSHGIERGVVDLFFVDQDAIAILNENHMGHQGPTDVLSFPLDMPDSAGSDSTGQATPIDMGEGSETDLPVPVHLGDVVISPYVVRCQSAKHTGSEDAEFALLTIHGVLHLLGFDHGIANEALAMQGHEREMMQRHGYEHPIRVEL